MSTPAVLPFDPAVADSFLALDAIRLDPRRVELARVMTTKVGRTSAGFPYLPEPSWTRFRDWVPHTLGEGPGVLAVAASVLQHARQHDVELAKNVESAHQVIRQVVMTAAITAPPDGWLLRLILGAFRDAGLSARLLNGDRIDPEDCTTDDGARLLAHEVRCDLAFLLSRGLLLAAQGGYRLADHDTARAAFSAPFSPHESGAPSGLAAAWTGVFTSTASDAERDALHASLDVTAVLRPSAREPGRWQAPPEDIALSARLVPLVLGLRAADCIPKILDTGRIEIETLTADAHLAAEATRTLDAAGALEHDGTLREGTLSEIGRRVLDKGPGPFGIIETYHPYLAQLPAIWRRGRTAVWVERTANVAASQDANRKSFERANATLDRFCDDSGFRYSVFIEHALGKGEATRQRFVRAGETLAYVGADLEDKAIDAAQEEQAAGNLPASMTFVRDADIGLPMRLLDGLEAAGVSPEGAVMIVGNGFHEVRGQTDERMTEIFAGYERAGILILFTEETALSVDDLLQTAHNTYHAGFKYVHERSGQGLRPAVVRPPSVLEGRLPASWTECAERAGYVRLDSYSSRSRTVYPYTPTSGHNPAISVTHFCVPQRIAASLGLHAGGHR